MQPSPMRGHVPPRPFPAPLPAPLPMPSVMSQTNRVRVLLASDGSVVNVCRVAGERVVCVIWQRPVSVAEGPFVSIFEGEAAPA